MEWVVEGACSGDLGAASTFGAPRGVPRLSEGRAAGVGEDRIGAADNMGSQGGGGVVVTTLSAGAWGDAVGGELGDGVNGGEEEKKEEEGEEWGRKHGLGRKESRC